MNRRYSWIEEGGEGKREGEGEEEQRREKRKNIIESLFVKC